MCRNSGCTGRSALYYYMYYNGFPLLFKALFAFLCHFFGFRRQPCFCAAISSRHRYSRLQKPPCCYQNSKKEHPHSLKGCKDILFGADEGI